MSDMENNSKVKRIRWSWWGEWIHSKTQNRELLDFHLLDDAEIVFNVIDHDRNKIEPGRLSIPAFEEEFGISMIHLLNF